MWNVKGATTLYGYCTPTDTLGKIDFQNYKRRECYYLTHSTASSRKARAERAEEKIPECDISKTPRRADIPDVEKIERPGNTTP